jgi:4-hydroxybenzoyl-CoA reductase alpha subunit
MAKDEYTVIGQSLPRVDATVKVTGEGRFVSDIQLPGMLYGKVLRSPYAHAKILNVDISKAERLPGVKAVVTAQDTPRKKFCPLPRLANNLILQDEKVRYIGDQVAAVAAIDEDIAEEALDLITVEYEELPAVFDPEEAMNPEAPKIHIEEKNIAVKILRHFGDVEGGFAKSDMIVEGRFKSQAIAHCCMEPRGCVALFDFSEKLTVWSTTQTPHSLREELAEVLGIPIGKLRVMRCHVGGGFGSRVGMDPIDAIASVLSMKTRIPVRIVNTREEEFISSRIRYPMIINIKTGANKYGKLIAREARVVTDNGAYNNKGSSVTAGGLSKMSQLYCIPNIKCEGLMVYTNNVYGGACRGYGNPQITFAMETQMDEVAEKLGMDPAEIRLINANQPNTITGSGCQITSCGLKECTQVAVDHSGWKKKRGKMESHRGIGMAVMIHGGSGIKGYKGANANFSSAIVKVNHDGTADVFSGSAEIGQGSETVVAQIAAEELGILFRDINIVTGDTDITPPCLGAWGTRQTFIAGNAVRYAAADAKRQLLQVAADLLLEARVEDLEIKNRKICVKGSPEKAVSVQQAASWIYTHVGIPIIGKGINDDPWSYMPDPKTGYGNVSSAYAFAAQVAEVEVDIDTGLVHVIKLTCAHDVGRTINPLLAKGQVVGGVLSMGLGYALTENLAIENGAVLTKNFLDYKLPTALDICDVECFFIESNDPNGPFGAKGVGEPAMIPTAAAISNAIYDAIGVRITDLPITPERILKALKEQRNNPQK